MMEKYTPLSYKTKITHQRPRYIYFHHNSDNNRNMTTIQNLMVHIEPPRPSTEPYNGIKKGTSLPYHGNQEPIMEKSVPLQVPITTTFYSQKWKNNLQQRARNICALAHH